MTQKSGKGFEWCFPVIGLMSLGGYQSSSLLAVLQRYVNIFSKIVDSIIFLCTSIASFSDRRKKTESVSLTSWYQ